MLTAMLAMAIMLWAEAGLAMLPGDQVMACTMTMDHGRSIAGDEAMACCPEEGAPALSTKRPPCCSVSNAPERPLGFVVSSERSTVHQLDAVPDGPASLAPPLAQRSRTIRSADAPRFVKLVLDLKSDLRI